MKMQNKLISVIIPTFNRKLLLKRAIESILNQDTTIGFDWEIIIIDDGSTDGTHEMVNYFVAIHPNNIQYHYQKNSGVGAARNK